MIYLGMFISNWQRPAEVVSGLRSKPFWDISEIDTATANRIRKLKNNWKTILQEGLDLNKTLYNWQHNEHLLSAGRWNYLQFFTGKLYKSTITSIIRGGF